MTQAGSQPQTIIDLIDLASARLTQAGVAFGHGTATAFDEAAWLVLWSLKLPIDDLDSVEQQTVSTQEAEQALALIEQRITSRKPAAYLTQEAWLQGVPFYVDERAIVPRSFIAEALADGSIDHWLSDQTHRVLDLCTGNGSLAVLAAMAYPDVTVDGADLSEDALAVARINVDKHGLAERITLLQSDGLQNVRGPYDLILCNPPYVNARSMAALPAEYQAEPDMALGSGDDGMDFCRMLIAALRAEPDRFMSPEAVLVLEIGNEREHFEAAFHDEQMLLIHRDALQMPG